ncbi:MAG: M56 family metallopeptidase [Clostridiales bacterium]|nr:M56 family metallopeptidase [Clostridiales bacterium]
MDKLFLTVLNMSLTGTFVIAAVCLARLPLKKAPKIISYCLWAVVAFRLLCPLSITSAFSLLPINTQAIPPDMIETRNLHIDSGIGFLDDSVNFYLKDMGPEMRGYPVGSGRASHQIYTAQEVTNFFMILWLTGFGTLSIYGVMSYLFLKRKMSGSAHLESNLYESEMIESPFVLGVLKPQIYLPVGLSEQEKSYIVLHEQTHVRRADHIMKFAAYFILSLHWFNPLAWVAFILMGVDMEMSCDERVLREMGSETKKAYSLSLLSLATERRFVGGSPLAFGEGGIKERVKNVLKFKKTSRMILIAAVVLAVALSAGFAVNRAVSNDDRVDLPSATISYNGKSAIIELGNKEQIPYVELGSTISMNFGNARPSSISVIEVIANADGSRKYAEQTDKTLEIELSGSNLATFRIEKNIGDMLSSNSDDYLSGNAWRWYRIFCNDDGRSVTEYGLWLRTDPAITMEGELTLDPASWRQIHLGTPIETVRELLGEPTGMTSGVFSDWYVIDENTNLSLMYRQNDAGVAVVSKIKLNGEQIEPWEREITPTPAQWALDQSLGADNPILDYAGQTIDDDGIIRTRVIFHGYFGLFVYDAREREILYSLDLKSIGCDSTQGDAFCEVAVDVSGDIVTLHPQNSETMYVLQLWGDPRLFETPFDNNYMTKFRAQVIDQAFLEHSSAFPYGQYSDTAARFSVMTELRNGQGFGEYTYFGYLYFKDTTIGGIQYREDDMGFTIFQ